MFSHINASNTILVRKKEIVSTIKNNANYYFKKVGQVRQTLFSTCKALREVDVMWTNIYVHKRLFFCVNKHRKINVEANPSYDALHSNPLPHLVFELLHSLKKHQAPVN